MIHISSLKTTFLISKLYLAIVISQTFLSRMVQFESLFFFIDYSRERFLGSKSHFVFFSSKFFIPRGGMGPHFILFLFYMLPHLIFLISKLQLVIGLFFRPRFCILTYGWDGWSVHFFSLSHIF